MLTRVLLVLLPLLVSICIAPTAFAQAWPQRPVTIVVPYAPGTGIDIVARTLAPKLAERLGQGFVVENKPGASGNLGADFTAKAQPNGYTLMITVTITLSPVSAIICA